MPLIPKPNYNQIFASQAPDIDKPSVFNNYPEGWGPESRPNNGKPTIKGFNYLQQTSDLKDLWILQNGACLPYDESIEYADGAPVLKDGVIQYKTASGFSPAISEKPYILSYFTEGDSYPLNARVMLDNGDIVKSIVANNIINPNGDMTGWTIENTRKVESIEELLTLQNIKDGDVVYVKSYYAATNFALLRPYLGSGNFIYQSSESTTNNGITVFNGWIRQFEHLNLHMSGAKGDGVADDTAAVQRSVDYAQQNNIALNALEGTYIVDEINVSSTSKTMHPLNLKGSGWQATIFQAKTAGQRSIFNLVADGVTKLSQFNTFSHFKIMGRGKAKVGFYSLCAPHSTFDHIYSMEFTEWGMFYLKESWSANIRSCRSSWNDKHGGYIGSNANGMNIDGCFFFLCGGWGLVIDGGLSVNIKGSGIESNKSGGIYANGVRNLNIIDTYFELNAENGVVLSPYAGVSSPNITVKTNILLNGTMGFENAGDKYLALPDGQANDYKCRAVRIAGTSLQTSFDGVSLVDVIAVDGLSVSDAVSLGLKKDTAIGVRVFASESRTSAKDVSIERMVGFNFPLVSFNNTATVSQAWQAGYNSIKFGRQYNLINPDLTQLVDLRYSTTGPVLTVANPNKYQEGRKVFTVKSSAVSTDRTRGKGWIINAADAEWAEFRGKSVYVTCLAKVYGNARLETYYNKDFESNFVPLLTTAQSNTWYQRRTITIKFPETGTLEFGFYMSNILNIATDYAEVSQLVVAPIGVDAKTI